MIVITGARGFIGSNLAQHLNLLGFNNLVLVDELENDAKNINILGLKYSLCLHRDDFFSWLANTYQNVNFIFHLGARTDTTEQNEGIFEALNLNYSKKIFSFCSDKQIPLLYASSAATYGDGALGYDDALDITKLQALNPYGKSKLDFDIWVLQQEKKPPFWVGLKFFNVYGPNENHKGRMASVVYHAFQQIQAQNKMRLFQSHKAGIEHGMQQRDFIYVNDIVAICLFFFNEQKHSGIYNAGTGKARSFNALVIAVFKALKKEVNIEYIPTPEDIRDAYQYFTEAKMDKLLSIGFQHKFTSLEDGVQEYVENLLSK